MFVPVACPECGKSFQVARDAVGEPAECPWCRRTVPALPIASRPRPLSLDEAEQLPPRKRWKLPVVRLLLLALVCATAGLATFAVARYGPQWWSGASWREFAPPNGDCRVLLPAEPVEETVAANPAFPVVRGGIRFVARRSDGMIAEVGWLDLDPDRALLTRPEDAIAAEQTRRSSTQPDREAAVRDGEHVGREYQFETPNGIRVERYLFVASGSKPRLYIVAASGAEWRRVVESFRLTMPIASEGR